MKRLAFDLDDTICTRSTNEGGKKKYHTCIPISERVRLVNDCYDAGYHITIYTARGMMVYDGDINKINENLRPLTENHLKEWGVKYHELVLGKNPYDLLICDKAEDIRSIKNISDIEERLKKSYE